MPVAQASHRIGLRTWRRLAALLLLGAGCLPLSGCDDDDNDDGGAGAGPIRLLVASRGPAALDLFDALTLERALDSPLALADAPVEARSDSTVDVFVTAFEAPDPARAFDPELFQEEPDPELGPGTRIAFARGRIYLAGASLGAFDAETLSELFPSVPLSGVATDVVYDPVTNRVFVAVTGNGARIEVFDGDDLSDVPPGSMELGGNGSTTGDLLLVRERSEVFVALPSDSRLAAIDAATLRALPRTPVDLRVPAISLARDASRERVYAAAADGRLDAVGATSFIPETGFPRDVAESASDLAFEPQTQRLVVADSARGRLVVLDGLTLDEEADSPVQVEGSPVSVEVLDLREP